MSQTVYLCGWLITTIGVLAAAGRVSDDGDSPPTRVFLSVGVVAGALWPLVITGLVEAAAIALIARRCKAVAARHSGLASIQLKEVLAFSS